MTKIEYALLAGLMAVTLVGAAAPLKLHLSSTFDRIAAALVPERERPCVGLECVAPAAGDPGPAPAIR